MNFGLNSVGYWKSSQRGYNKDSHLETRGEDTYSVTETVDFTKLVFERDKNAPNYGKIVSLEKEYFNVQASMPNEEPKVNAKHYSSIEEFASGEKKKLDVRTLKQKVLSLFLMLLGLRVAFALENVSGGSKTLIYIVQVIGLAMFVVGCIMIPVNKKKALASAINKTNEKCRAILESKYAENNKEFEKESGKVREYSQKTAKQRDILKELDSLIWI